MVRIVSYLLLVIFSVLAVFQILLALGLPLGAGAWGGQYRVLPASLRWSSVASALVLGLALLVVLEKLGLLTFLKKPQRIKTAFLALGSLFALSTLANLASSSPWENYLGAPVAATACLSCLHLGTRRVS